MGQPPGMDSMYVSNDHFTSFHLQLVFRPSFKFNHQSRKVVHRLFTKVEQSIFAIIISIILLKNSISPGPPGSSSSVHKAPRRNLRSRIGWRNSDHTKVKFYQDDQWSCWWWFWWWYCWWWYLWRFSTWEVPTILQSKFQDDDDDDDLIKWGSCKPYSNVKWEALEQCIFWPPKSEEKNYWFSFGCQNRKIFSENILAAKIWKYFCIFWLPKSESFFLKFFLAAKIWKDLYWCFTVGETEQG